MYVVLCDTTEVFWQQRKQTALMPLAQKTRQIKNIKMKFLKLFLKPIRRGKFCYEPTNL